MSLLGYQQALCDLVASPQLCLGVRADRAALDGYDLTDRERDRIAAAVASRGMSVSCTLYRVNRITPLYSYLPLSCTLLGDGLVGQAEIYWREGKPEDLQFGPETVRFAGFLRRQLAAGAIDDPYLGEVLALELAVNALRRDPGSPPRAVTFAHDPVPVLEALAAGRRPEAAATIDGGLDVEVSTVDGELCLRARPRAADV